MTFFVSLLLLIFPSYLPPLVSSCFPTKNITTLKMALFPLLLLIFTPAFALTPMLDDCVDRTCGSHTIHYPLWIDGLQPSYCGFTPFKLRCINQTGTPVLNIAGVEFYVNHIFYENESIQITSSYYANNNPCAFLFSGITGNVFPFALSSSNKEIVFFRNCSSSKNLLSYQNMSCHGDSVYFGGEFGGRDRPSMPNKACQLLRVPVAGNSLITIYGNYVALLKNGWLLNWIAPDCSECRRSGGRCRYNESAAMFMCSCRDRIHLKACRFSRHHMSSKKITITVVGGLVALVLCSCVLLLVYYKISNEKEEKKIEALLKIGGSLFPERYKYAEIRKMTKSFSEKLGQDGFGTVYKGTLKDGHPIAVKILHDFTGSAEEFIDEVASISRTSHVNIVNLLGFCLKGSKRALVYEFMPNGSLDKYIYAEKSALGYERLSGIAVGIAQGLEYLHYRCNTRIVHFDIKPHNILLDQDFYPKISYFRLAKLCTWKESVLSMAIPRGTIGYIAPEVCSKNFGVVSSKSNVYSYGMMLLEMFRVRRDFDAATRSHSEIYFPHWVHDYLNTINDNIIGIACLSSENKEIVRKMIMVSLWCIQMMPTNRPSMSMVLSVGRKH